MAIFRSVKTEFWTDIKVEEEFTPEDRYFYLYLFTNPHTNLCGCYKLGKQQAANQMGYSKETVEKLIFRFESVHEVIDYCTDTNEVYIKNWSKHTWTSSSKFLGPLRKEILEVKNEEFRRELGAKFDILLKQAREKAKDKELDRLMNIPYIYGIDTTVTVTNTVSDSNTNTDKEEKNNKYITIVGYLNEKAGRNFNQAAQATRKHINARLNEGFTEEDFFTVIDYKCKQWKDDPKMSEYLRPETLFGTKFESYLNAIPKKKVTVAAEPVIEEEPEMSDEEWLKYMQESDD